MPLTRSDWNEIYAAINAQMRQFVTMEILTMQSYDLISARYLTDEYPGIWFGVINTDGRGRFVDMFLPLPGLAPAQGQPIPVSYVRKRIDIDAYPLKKGDRLLVLMPLGEPRLGIIIGRAYSSTGEEKE